ncbi:MULTISPECIES: hypothetical protein [unclassified Pseudomonas]|nr:MULTISPECIES: hypothetical protein [unclassified Pseudomonas]MDG9922882.1 hypothetical protein [Pseudomonas sp. GD04045]MDH0035754.1 hypothetical protein [Pseudomonas sp. GD04019]
MIIRGQVLCNLCGCSMGFLLMPSAVAFHVCPDCQLDELDTDSEAA